MKLDRMHALLARVGNPHQRLRILHVAGSKGKGSVSAMLAAILQRAGYRTGLFTSPHLCRVEERIQVGGEPIPSAELAALLTELRDATRASGLKPTFFEIGTALGFLHFVRRRVEAAVVEVGLGGRFDSTNVCLPELAVVTSISLDHTRQLGNRLSSIAFEKAGIFKVHRPAISGVTAPEAQAVVEQVGRDRQVGLRQLGRDFDFTYRPGQIASTPEANGFETRPQVQVRTWKRPWPALEIGLLGRHQAANAAVVVACVERLRELGWHIELPAVAAGLAGVRWPARLEVVSRRPLTVLDCAHNVASAEALVETLETSFPPVRRLLVFACSNDKDVDGMLRVLAPHFSQAYFTVYANNPRAVPPATLAESWQRAGGTLVQPFACAADALHAAQAAAQAHDLICITGSVFLAGELRPHFVPSADPGLVSNHSVRTPADARIDDLAARG